MKEISEKIFEEAKIEAYKISKFKYHTVLDFIDFKDFGKDSDYVINRPKIFDSKYFDIGFLNHLFNSATMTITCRICNGVLGAIILKIEIRYELKTRDSNSIGYSQFMYFKYNKRYERFYHTKETDF